LAVEDEMMTDRDSDKPDTGAPATEDPPEGAQGTSGDEGLSQTVCFQVSRLSLLYRYTFLLVLTGIGVFLLSSLIPMVVSGKDDLIGGLLALWGFALLRYWAFLISTPHRICLEEDAILVLHALFRTRKIECSEISAMRVSPIYQSYLKIVTSGKKTFPMLNHVDGLYDLIGRIKAINPDLETRGC
jgi:hypothetical protein